MSKNNDLPMSTRADGEVQGHWLLARLGKRVLRPGGVELTTTTLDRCDLRGVDVVELAPGLGRTARDIIALGPRSYVGVDSDENAAVAVERIVAASGGRVVTADASATGLDAESADVVLGEAMLTMQGERTKREIVAEAARVLRPGGRYAIHELGLQPNTIAAEVKESIRQALARSIRVNARPQTVDEWTRLLEDAGLVVEHVDTAQMALLQPKRILADEGVLGTLRFVRNLLLRPGARKRVIAMRRTFAEHKDALIAVSIVAVKPLSTSAPK